MRPLAVYLQKQGISSYCPKLQGHGTSFYDVEKYRMKDWRKQLLAEAAKNKYDYVIGLCAGANLAVDLATVHKYEKVVLLSPLFWYAPKFPGLTYTFIIPLFHPIYRYYPKRPIHYESMVAYNILPTINVWDLYLYNRTTLKKLPQLQTKTLVIFGGADDLYSAKLPAYLAKTIPRAEVRIIPGAQHVITKDNNGAQEKCFALIKAFLL
jgi:carboxylesterase